MHKKTSFTVVLLCLEAYQRARKRMHLARESVPSQIRLSAAKAAQIKLRTTTDEEKIRSVLAKLKTEWSQWLFMSVYSCFLLQFWITFNLLKHFYGPSSFSLCFKVSLYLYRCVYFAINFIFTNCFHIPTSFIKRYWIT